MSSNIREVEKIFLAVKYLADKFHELGVYFKNEKGKYDKEMCLDNAMAVLAYFCYDVASRAKNGGCLSDLEKALYDSKFFFTSEYNNNIGDTYYLPELLFKNEQGEVSYLNRYNGYGGICYDETNTSLLKDEKEIVNLIAEDFFSYMNWGKKSNTLFDIRDYDKAHNSLIQKVSDNFIFVQTLESRRVLIYASNLEPFKDLPVFMTEKSSAKIKELNRPARAFETIFKKTDGADLELEF